MTIFRSRIAVRLALIPLIAAAPASFATRDEIRRMIVSNDGGKRLSAFVARHAAQRETLINDLQRAGFSHERRENGCDYLSGGIAGRQVNEGWDAFVWICRDTVGARSRYAVNI